MCRCTGWREGEREGVWKGGIVRGVGGEVRRGGVVGAPFSPPAGGGTGEVVVRVQAGSRSSFRPGPASFPPPVGGGTREVVVQVRDGVRGVFRSSCPSAASFPPPRGGGTRGVVVRVRDDVRGGFCLSVAAFPPSVEGGTLGGVGDRAQATTRVGPAPWLFLATPGIGTCVAECFAANPVHSVKLLQGLPG